jgi:hypothetical protein
VTPPAWADIEADIEAALREVERASRKQASLAGQAGDPRENAEMAIGKHIHDAYSAAEKALERAVEIADGGVPLGRSFRRDLIRRAAIPIPGVRPPIIAPETEAALLRLVGFRHAFRHVYGGLRLRPGRAEPRHRSGSDSATSRRPRPFRPADRHPSRRLTPTHCRPHMSCMSSGAPKGADSLRISGPAFA